MTDDLKLVELPRWDGVICPPHEMPPDTDPNITALAGFANEATVHGKTALRALEMLANQGTAIRRLVHELGEARNNLIQARNERDEDRQQRRDLHARYAVEISAMRADRERLVRERDRLAALDAENAELRAAKDALWREYREAKNDWHEECADNRKLFEDWQAAEADRDRLAKLVAEMREGLSDAAAHLAAASSAYRAHAARHRSVGRATSDPFFTTRVGDFDRAAERACTLLQRTQEVE